MPSIFTITFSPCIDKSTSVERLLPEKKLKCSSPKTEPGGGGINVARAIHKLGGKCIAIYPTGGCTGALLNKLMTEERVRYLSIETESETRENLIILEETSQKQYRFGMPGAFVKKTEWQLLLNIIEEKMENESFLIASGSLPPGMPADIFARLGMIARNKNARFVADTSGEALKLAVKEGVYLLKPNLGELSSLVNKDYLEPDEIPIAARQIINNGHCEIAMVSLGEKGALLVTKQITRMIPAPVVVRKSTVGAGDSMVAGIVLSLWQGLDIETAAQYGVACGTAATMNPGTELCRKEDADNLFKHIQSAACHTI